MIDEFSPVSLDELVRDAALMTRVDRKYLVPWNEAGSIIASLDASTRALEIDGERNFGYVSQYFDTADHASYRLTAQRRRRRFKVRTRHYVNTGVCFLEVKTRDGRGKTVKERIPYSPIHRETLDLVGCDFVAGVLQANRQNAEVAFELRTSTMSKYNRATLLLQCGSRATIDTNLEWFGVEGGYTTLTDHVIIESKSVGRISALDRALWNSGHRPTVISKFGTGTAALNPDLPRNKWARTLRGPFLDTTQHGVCKPQLIGTR